MNLRSLFAAVCCFAACAQGEDGGHGVEDARTAYSGPLFPYLTMSDPDVGSGDGFGRSAEELALWGYMSAAGAEFIPPRFSHALPFNGEYAIVQFIERKATRGYLSITASWGVIDRTGSLVVPARYAYIEPFTDGMGRAIPSDGSETGFINISGEMAIPWDITGLGFDLTGGFSEGLARVAVASPKGAGQAALLQGYIDPSGAQVIAPRFNSVSDFHEGLAAAQPQDGVGFGFIDRAGSFVIEPQFDNAGSFSERLAWVSREGRYGYIDRAGAVVIPFRYDAAGNFSEGMAAVRIGGSFGFIDSNGDPIVEPKYDAVGRFAEGRAAVGMKSEIGYLWGFIDSVGDEVLPIQYANWEAPVFRHGLALVQVKVEQRSTERWNRGAIVDVYVSGYIDLAGKWVYGPIAGPWYSFVS